MENRPKPEQTRRPGVRAAPMALADGLVWGLALPAYRHRPSVVRGVDVLGRPTETIQLAVEFGHPAPIRRAIDRLRAECEAGDPSGQREAVVSLGVALLLRAHDLDAGFAASLFEASAEEFPRLAEAIVEVVTNEEEHVP